MNERRLYFREHRDDIKQLLMNEPRGHSAMSGAILQPPTRPDCDWGVVYIEVSGYLPMCGHGTIGVATVLVETGMVEVVEPVTTIRLDTPAGLVVAEVAVEDGRAKHVTLQNVPSFAVALDRKIALADGRTVTYDLAYGGNFYAILPLDRFGLPFDRARKDDILKAGLSLMEAINAEEEPVHPDDPSIRGCHHVHLIAPGATARHSRHAMAIHPGWFDRSPAAPAPARAWPSCTRAANSPAHRVRERVLHRDSVHGPAPRHHRGGGPPRRPAQFHRAGVDHRHGAVPARPDRSVPGGIRPVSPEGVDDNAGCHVTLHH